VILQVGQTYPFIRLAIHKKPQSARRAFYYTDQHFFDPENDKLIEAQAYFLTVGSIQYDNSRDTDDGFKRAYRLWDEQGRHWLIHFPEDDFQKKIWRPFQTMAYCQKDETPYCAVWAEELLTAYCRKMEQRKAMVRTETSALWPFFYNQLVEFARQTMHLHAEVYPYQDPVTGKLFNEIPCVKLKPIQES